MNYVQGLKQENRDLKEQIDFARAETKMLNCFLDSSNQGGQKSFVVSVAEVKNFTKRITVALTK